MNPIKADELMIAYDKDLGVVYAPKKGIIKTTSAEHAQALDIYWSQYINGQLSVEDKQSFELYVEKYFGHLPDLPLEIIKDLGDRKVLRRLTIIVANDCNLACKYCFANNGNYGMNIQRMSPDTALTYLEKLLIGKFDYVNTVMFFGGEPLLCPDTIQAICNFFQENVNSGIFREMPNFLMVTNGTLIDRSVAELIKRYNIGTTVSIDGPPEINDLLRVNKSGAGSYTRIVRGIERLNEFNISPGMFEVTYTSKHAELGYTKKDIKNYLRNSFSVDNIIIADCCKVGDNDSLSYTDWSIGFENYDEAPAEDLYRVLQNLTQGVFADVGCDAGFGSLILLPNGDLYPCQHFISHPEYQIATYCDDKFIFSNYEEVRLKFTNAHRSQNPQCAECWAKAVCTACPVALLLEKDKNIREAFCHRQRLLQKRLILACAKKQLSETKIACAQE